MNIVVFMKNKQYQKSKIPCGASKTKQKQLTL